MGCAVVCICGRWRWERFVRLSRGRTNDMPRFNMFTRQGPARNYKGHPEQRGSEDGMMGGGRGPIFASVARCRGRGERRRDGFVAMRGPLWFRDEIQEPGRRALICDECASRCGSVLLFGDYLNDGHHVYCVERVQAKRSPHRSPGLNGNGRQLNMGGCGGKERA